VPAIRARGSADAPSRAATAKAQTDPQLVERLARVDARLQALDARITRQPARTPAPAGASADATTTQNSSAGHGESSDEVMARLQADHEYVENAPPARELLATVLRVGILTREDIKAFHHRLDEVPLEERPALLKEFQSAINEGKLRFRK
jgi:hypothetical protein